MKKSLVGFTTAAALALTAGVSMAALPSLDAGNTTMASELVSPTQDTPAPATFIAYQVNGAVAPTTTLRFTLGNGTFVTGSTWDLCSIAAGVPVQHTLTSAPIAAGATSVDIKLDPTKDGLGVGTLYYLQDNACAAVPAGAGNINVLADTKAGTVTMAVDSVTNPGDAKVAIGPTTIITLKDELSANIIPVTTKMEFSTGRTTLIDDTATPGLFADSPQTAVAGSVSEAFAKLVVAADTTSIQKGIAFTVAPDKDCAGTMNPADKFNVKLSGNLTGIDKVEVVPHGTGIVAPAPVTLSSADYTNGFVTISVPGDQMGICSSLNPNPGSATSLGIIVDTTLGTTKAPALVAGDITAEVKVVGQNAAPVDNSRVNATRVLKTAVSHSIVFNGTQYYLELVRADATHETYVKLQSKNTTSGANGVSVQVLATDGSLVKFTPAANSGVIGAGQPFTVSGSEMAAAVAAQSKTVSPDGFAAIITVNAPEADVFGYANILDSTGSKRVPLKTVNGTIVE